MNIKSIIGTICIYVFAIGITTSANASLIFSIERVSDTKAKVTATGTLGSTFVEGDGDTISFQNPFNLEPIGFDNRSVFDTSTMQVGSLPISNSWIMAPDFSPANGTSWIYFTSNAQGSFAAGSAVSGTLEWMLPADLSLAAVGSTGIVTWGTASQGVETGTWTMVQAVPIPAAVWLFGAGLIGLVGLARRKKV